jgi:hypothetical protein
MEERDALQKMIAIHDLEIDTHPSTLRHCAAPLKELLLSNVDPEALPGLARS